VRYRLGREINEPVGYLFIKSWWLKKKFGGRLFVGKMGFNGRGLSSPVYGCFYVRKVELSK
jgi:hypothetical protein